MPPAQVPSRFRRLWIVAAAAACLLAAVWTYDSFGYSHALGFEAEHADDPAAVLRCWQTFRTWHPTRHLLGVSSWHAEAGRLHELAQRMAQQEGEAKARKAQAAYDDLRSAEGRGTDLALLAGQADAFLQDFAGTPPEAEVRRLRAVYVRRIDERDFELARGFSAENPLEFAARRDYFQAYLDRHPSGAFAAEAESALRGLDADWDRHDFRRVRDHVVNRPGDLGELVPRCRAYLAAHPRGQFVARATELLRWSERVSVPGDYRVVIRSGQIERRLGYTFSRGPDLSVEIEVAGVRHGPSTIVRNSYSPVWEYEFPRPVRWRLGDPVHIRVTDHDYRPRVVLDIVSAEGDPLAMAWLNGDVWCNGSRLTFASDFTMPPVPWVE
jgi:hypothetical protein